ncbi:hypothetical protein B0H67DRAFT_607158 [Lasiosphaeris hirsuta]|uniref:Uncharacterized protein n=1 Tax=Lasiosphaeris hirsuta TaxID=260670 RepID=A0AA40E1N7_9PEZI|nr:hypothetical protein B0H67DRAFT_607158 [Lasiosphaeris hirsuta]
MRTTTARLSSVPRPHTSPIMTARVCLFVLNDCAQYDEDVRKTLLGLFPAEDAAFAAFQFEKAVTDGLGEIEYHWVIVVGFARHLKSADEAEELHTKLAHLLHCTKGDLEYFKPTVTTPRKQALAELVDGWESALKQRGCGRFAKLGESTEFRCQFGSFSAVREKLHIRNEGCSV